MHSRFNKKIITDSIKLILNNNSFHFNNVNYIRAEGTAMANEIASTHATLTLAYLEENLYEIIGKKYSSNIKREFTKSWKRYFVDCFMFRNCSWETLTNYITDSKTYTLKWNWIWNTALKNYPFLDILKQNENGQILADIYQKPTDTQQYFHFK